METAAEVPRPSGHPLRKFVEREGHSLIPQAHRENGYRVGQWAAVQRQAYRKGTLDAERRSRLEALPDWTWDRREAAWKEGFARLQSYVQREGHSRVPDKYREGGFGLGSWVSRQRTQKQDGTLSDERARRLESLPGWTWDPLEAAWEEGFARLQSYIRREGHSRVPDRFQEDGFWLEAWVRRQRIQQRDGTLSDERFRRLESIPGWVWDTRRVTPAR